MVRTERLFRYGSPALQAAFAQGLLSLYRCGEIAKLPAGQQEIAVAQWTGRFLARIEGQAIAAKVIREELARENSAQSKLDLGRVSSAIRAAIREK
jgi:hypothetical protein